MAAEVFPMVKGSAEPIVVQLYDAVTEAVVDLSGATAMSAKATDPSTGNNTGAGLSAALYGAATLGKVLITYAPDAWPAVGTYDLQISYTDGAGNPRKYPSEGNQLKIRITGAN